MKGYPIIGMAIIALLITACDRASKSTDMKVYHNGNEYEVLERGDRIDEGEASYFIRYHSADPMDEAVRQFEQKDILAIVAKHIDTNKHERIIITAVEEKGGWFGLKAPFEHTERYSAEYVLTFNPAVKPEGNDG